MGAGTSCANVKACRVLEDDAVAMPDRMVRPLEGAYPADGQHRGGGKGRADGFACNCAAARARLYGRMNAEGMWRTAGEAGRPSQALPWNVCGVRRRVSVQDRGAIAASARSGRWQSRLDAVRAGEDGICGTRRFDCALDLSRAGRAFGKIASAGVAAISDGRCDN